MQGVTLPPRLAPFVPPWKIQFPANQTITVKTKRSWVIALCAFIWVQTDFWIALAADGAAKEAASDKSNKAATATPESSENAGKPGTNASSKKKRPHPPTTAFDRAVDPTIIPTAPPAPPSEQTLPQPGANYVWVPGHYVPVERKWTWTAGKWMIPPDPKAIWIQGRYVVETQRWSSGYWQPGDPTPETTSPPVSAEK